MSFSVLSSSFSETSSNKEPDTVYSLHFALFQNIPLLYLFHGERGYSSLVNEEVPLVWVQEWAQLCKHGSLSFCLEWSVGKLAKFASRSQPLTHLHIYSVHQSSLKTKMKVHKSTGSRTCGQVFFQQVVRGYSDHLGRFLWTNKSVLWDADSDRTEADSIQGL